MALMPMPGCVVTVNPNSVAMTPRRMPRNPMPAHPLMPIIWSVPVIRLITDLDGESSRLGRRRRNNRTCAEEHSQKNGKFVFHGGFPYFVFRPDLAG